MRYLKSMKIPESPHSIPDVRTVAEREALPFPRNKGLHIHRSRPGPGHSCPGMRRRQGGAIYRSICGRIRVRPRKGRRPISGNRQGSAPSRPRTKCRSRPQPSESEVLRTQHSLDRRSVDRACNYKRCTLLRPGRDGETLSPGGQGLNFF